MQVFDKLVCRFSSSNCAPTIAAPEESVTLPRKDETEFWPNTTEAHSNNQNSRRHRSRMRADRAVCDLVTQLLNRGPSNARDDSLRRAGCAFCVRRFVRVNARDALAARLFAAGSACSFLFL